MADWNDVKAVGSAHDEFLGGEQVGDRVRGPILASWQRCRMLGITADHVEVLYHDDLDFSGPLVQLARPILDELGSTISGIRASAVLCDASARVLDRRVGEPSLNSSLDRLRLAPGFGFAEESTGTNGMGTALAERKPAFVYGREHFADAMRLLACAAAPIRDPLSGQVLGALDLTCFERDADPAMLPLVREAARDIERALLDRTQARERALYRTFLATRAGSGLLPQATGAGDGLSPRDRLTLQERAAELISAGRTAITEIRLSGGGTAVLLAHAINASPRGAANGAPPGTGGTSGTDRTGSTAGTGSTGGTSSRGSRSSGTGVVVEVALPGGTLRHVATDTTGGGAGRTEAPGVGRTAAFGADPSGTATPGRGRTDGTGGPDRTQATALILPGGVAHSRPTPEPAPAPAPTPELTPAPEPAPVTALTTPPAAAPAAPGPGGFSAATAEELTAAMDKCLLAVGDSGVSSIALLARRRLGLLAEAGVAIGTTLDVTRTAEELAEVAVRGLADYVTVDLPEAVLSGDEPIRTEDGLHRVAVGGIRPDAPLFDIGDVMRYVPSTPQARSLATGDAVLEPVLAASGWLEQDPARGGEVLRHGIHSLITVPLVARGTILGVVGFYRSERPEPFEDDDLSLAEELARRAATCIDNARLYTREHTMALALQRSLLPHSLPPQNAVDAAYRYLPAHSGAGGDWFDVIPLSGARVALAVGDVVGHGVHAAAAMGRLRTAIHNFSALDLSVDEVLTQLDDLVAQLDMNADPGGTGDGTVGATCLYAVYDPVTRVCTFARAGHPPPVLVLPDGTVEFLDLPGGQMLGLGGGLPFETVDVEVPEGTQLVLYTDGLVEQRERDIDVGLDLLRRTLTVPSGGPEVRPRSQPRSGGRTPDLPGGGLTPEETRRTPEETCQAVLGAMLPDRPCDDIALLVARTRALGADQAAHWELPSDPAAVSRVRTAVTECLDRWGLSELAFVTELIASELVTNAIRYGDAPIGLRLLRDRTLICEVSDGSSTSPRMRRARTTDEGGRGLFLVAQLAKRWGTRYTPTGKVIWTEQPLG
ncbi:SpoIIE family protein phosphatase [Streptomyces sp. NPDC088400]|uniref:SpoIIE family protein phosphatase n=1 Tax=Streptomyces sp. NPDC088400 TaxID=3365861 RepID=UPI00381FBCB9